MSRRAPRGRRSRPQLEERAKRPSAEPARSWRPPKRQLGALLAALLLAALLEPRGATSNINSVWLARDETPRLSQAAADEPQAKASGRQNEWRPAGVAPNEPKPEASSSIPLQAASSSLLPAFSAFEAADQASQRRSDAAAADLGPSILLEPAATPTSDPHAAQAGGAHQEASRALLDFPSWNKTEHNKEVQFDEAEHLLSGAVGQQAANLNALIKAIQERQQQHEAAAALNETGAFPRPAANGGALNDTSELHTVFASSAESGADPTSSPRPRPLDEDAILRGAWQEAPLNGATSSEPKSEPHNSKQYANSTNERRGDPFAYFLSEGADRWAPSEAVEQRPSAKPRRQLHNAGTNYDLREQERAQAHFEQEQLQQRQLQQQIARALAASEAHRTAPPDAEGAQLELAAGRKPAASLRPTLEPDTPLLSAPTIDDFQGPAYDIEPPAPLIKSKSKPAQQLEHFRPAGNVRFVARPASSAFYPPPARTTPMPQYAAGAAGFAGGPPSVYSPLPESSASLTQQLALRNLQSHAHAPLGRPALVKPRVVAHPPRAYALRQPAAESAAGRRLVLLQRPAGAAHNKALFGQPTSKQQQQSRRSLLASLSNRLNNWVELASRPELGAGLEASFYSAGLRQPGAEQLNRRMRPAAAHLDYLTPHRRYHSAPPWAYYPPTLAQGHAHPARDDYYHYAAVRSQLHPFAVQQPTVAPAPSSLDRFYGPPYPTAAHSLHYATTPARHAYHHGQQPARARRHQHPHQQQHGRLAAHGARHARPLYHGGVAGTRKKLAGSDPQPASFIPVVAVSVTKTSPAPKVAPPPASYFVEEAPLPQHQEDSSSAAQIDEYLNLRVGNKPRDRERVYQSRDSAPRQTIMRAPLVQQSAGDSAQAPHTTTVKSAIFGYLPAAGAQLEAASPLLSAIGPLLGSDAAAGSPSRDPSHAHHHHHQQQQQHRHQTLASGAGDASYAHPHEAPIGEAHAHAHEHLLDHQHHEGGHAHFGQQPPIEEPPSLALQLQANSFVQNDIAHPFYEDSAAASSGHSSRAQVAPIDVYPAGHFHSIQLLKPDHHQAAASLAQSLLNPLLAGEASYKSPHFLASAASGEGGHAHAPFMPAAILFQPPPSQQTQIAAPPSTNNHNNNNNKATLDPASAADQEQAASSGSGHALATASGAGPGGGSQLNSKGKKRSSEFFASAGQLLLSALPLLLAPTLGLMFASSPANPAARFHGAGGANSLAQASGAGSIQHSMPSTDSNGLAIAKPSPAPQFFTPIPPGYLLTTTTISSKPANKSASASASPGRSTTPKPRTRNHSTTPAPRLTVSLTTLSPPPFGASNGSDPEQGANATGESGGGHSRSKHPSGGHTIVLVTQETHEPHHFAAPASGNASSASASASDGALSDERTRNHYDVSGYEGVDFDAQYASLRRPAGQHQLKSGEGGVTAYDHRLNLRRLNNSSSASKETQSQRDKNRYHYAAVTADTSLLVNGTPLDTPTREGARPAAAATVDDSASTKLYPVSTWPPMRRRTVSLVTSNGNKTMPDSSDKYSDVHAHLSSLGRNQTQQPAATKFDDELEDDEQPREKQRNSTGAHQISRRQKREASEASGGWRPAQGANLAEPNKDEEARRRSSALEEPAPSRRRRKVRVKKVKGGLAGLDRWRVNELEKARSALLNGSALEADSARRRVGGAREPGEQLRGDASKSKTAHIITTTITHLTDEPDERPAPTGDSSGGGHAHREQLYSDSQLYNNKPADFYSQRQASELREQIAHKRLILEQLNAGEHHAPEESEQAADLFSLGGRGHFPAAPAAPPVEISSTKIRLYANGTLLAGDADSGQPAANKSEQPGGGGLVLAEKTKRALADFGTLLLKDTLRLPDERPPSANARRHHEEEADAQSAGGVFGGGPQQLAVESAATERSTFTHSSFPENLLIETPAFGPPRVNRPSGGATPTETSDWSPPREQLGPSQHQSYGSQHQRRPSAEQSGADLYADARHRLAARTHGHAPYPHSSAGGNGSAEAGGSSAAHEQYLRAWPPLFTGRDRVNLLENDPPASGGYQRGVDERPPLSEHYLYADKYNHNGASLKAAAEQRAHQSKFDPTNSLNGYNLYTTDHISSTLNRQNESAASQGDAETHRYAPSPSAPPAAASYYANASGAADQRRLLEQPLYGIPQLPEAPMPNTNSHYAGPPFSGPPSASAGSHAHGSSSGARRGAADSGSMTPGALYDLMRNTAYNEPAAGSGSSGGAQPDQFAANQYSGGGGGYLSPHSHHRPQASSNPNYHAHHHPHPHPHENSATPPGYPPVNHHYSGSTQANKQLHPPADYAHQSAAPFDGYAPSGGRERYYQAESPAARYASNARFNQAGAEPEYAAPQRQPLPPPPPFEPPYPPVKYSTMQRPRPAAGQQQPYSPQPSFYNAAEPALPPLSNERHQPSGGETRVMDEYLKRVQFSDSDRDKLMASYLTCDGLLNDNDHCLERLACEFSDPLNIEKANKLDRAVSSILLGHILINTYVSNQFKLRLKSASLFGYTQSGKCSRYVCNKLTKPA